MISKEVILKLQPYKELRIRRHGASSFPVLYKGLDSTNGSDETWYYENLAYEVFR